MSNSRGNITRKRPQKHQNTTAFKNDLHDTSKQTKMINSLEIIGVCGRCKNILDWKIKYKKYKPLTAPRKCVSCEQKTIKSAYHVLCKTCAYSKNVCSKCCKPLEVDEVKTQQYSDKDDITLLLQNLPERKRRTIMRNLMKQQNGDVKVTQEAKDYIAEVMSKMGDVNLDDSSFSDDDLDDSEEDK